MVERARVVGLILLGWFSAATASAEQWLPIEVRDGLLTFPAVVEGVETRAVLNTSAPFSSVDAAFAQQIGLTLSGRRQQISGAYSGSRVVASEAQLAIELLGEKAVLRDTPALHHPDTPLQLGAAFLEPFVLQIDYPSSRIRIVPRAALDLRKQDNVPMRSAGGSCLRIRTSNTSPDPPSGINDFSRQGGPSRLHESTEDMPCLPTVQATFPGGKKVWLLLDTGASGPVVVSRSIAQREGWLDAHPSSRSASSDIFGTRVGLDLLVLPSLRLGPFELGDVPIAVPAEGERLFSGRENHASGETGTHITHSARASGWIGYDALRHFVVTIDLERELMQIAQPKEPSAEARGASEAP
jgi:hypothetical protein